MRNGRRNNWVKSHRVEYNAMVLDPITPGKENQTESLNGDTPGAATAGTGQPRFDPEKAVAKVAYWLQLLTDPGQVTELRALKVRRPRERSHTESGFFDSNHLGDMARAAIQVTKYAKGVYFTLNPLRGDMLARRANRMDWAEEGEPAADKDVIRRRWLLVDADPVRD